MAFLDETGLAELWALVKAEDTKLAQAGVRVATGSYTGTDTYGSSKPCSLTFDFAPKLVVIVGWAISNGGFVDAYAQDESSSSGLYSCFTGILTTSYVRYRGFSTWKSDSYAKKSSDGKTISWYNNYSGSDTANRQLNAAGNVYYYYAIG